MIVKILAFYVTFPNCTLYLNLRTLPYPTPYRSDGSGHKVKRFLSVPGRIRVGVVRYGHHVKTHLNTGFIVAVVMQCQ